MNTRHGGQDRAVETAVERICALGCREVTRHILALQADEPLPGYSTLDSAQRRLLLHELQAIMAVYERDGS